MLKLIFSIMRKMPYSKRIYHYLRDRNELISLKKQEAPFYELYKLFNVQGAESRRFDLNWEKRTLFDDSKSVDIEPHYLYHTAWAARKLREISPEKHVDISSSLNFIFTVSAFVPIDFYDFNPPKVSLPGVTVDFADLNELPFPDNSIKSLSCLHVIEHVGLGRYGGKIDYDGDLKSISELKRILAYGGDLLLAVPVCGKPEIIFNAHRIYNYKQIIELFYDFQLKEFSLVCDDSSFISNATEELSNKQKWGCGCFWFRKKCDSSLQ